MLDVKQQLQLFGTHWNRCQAVVQRPGDPEAGSEEGEWKYAVLEVRPLGTPFYVAWRNRPAELPEFLDQVIEVDSEGRFGMKEGPRPAEFLVTPADFKTILFLRWVETVDRDNPRYKDTPGY